MKIHEILVGAVMFAGLAARADYVPLGTTTPEISVGGIGLADRDYFDPSLPLLAANVNCATVE